MKFPLTLPVALALSKIPLSLSAGAAQIRDADTIVVDGTPVRLQGVDAPELGTRAGQAAKRWMVHFLRGKEVRCELTYDRWVGVCFTDGGDIGAAVIGVGHALDCARYSGGRYQRDLRRPQQRQG